MSGVPASYGVLTAAITYVVTVVSDEETAEVESDHHLLRFDSGFVFPRGNDGSDDCAGLTITELMPPGTRSAATKPVRRHTGWTVSAWT